MQKYVALIRGVQVGTVCRVSMHQLRQAAEMAGFHNIRITQNCDNMTFELSKMRANSAARRLEEVLNANPDVHVKVIVLSAKEFKMIVQENPFPARDGNPTRFQVAFLKNPRDRDLLAPLQRRAWVPEMLALGRRVAYLWCPGGYNASTLMKSVLLRLSHGGAMITASWKTVMELQQLMEKG